MYNNITYRRVFVRKITNYSVADGIHQHVILWRGIFCDKRFLFRIITVIFYFFVTFILLYSKKTRQTMRGELHVVQQSAVCYCDGFVCSVHFVHKKKKNIFSFGINKSILLFVSFSIFELKIKNDSLLKQQYNQKGKMGVITSYEIWD